MAQRPPLICHATSEPYRFFGRTAELTLLDAALAGGPASVIALVGPGGQGKTAIVQHWLESFIAGKRSAAGVFLWSFYRGKDADRCLRELYSYATEQGGLDVSASYCVDHLLPLLRAERWAVLLDGVEVAQYDSGPWFGRFIHPELGRLLEELSSTPIPGVVVLTSRFPLPEIERRRHLQLINLGGLDSDSARKLLRGVGVHGSDSELDEAAAVCGFHAKAVELLGTYLTRFHGGSATRHRELPAAVNAADASSEEQKVARVLAAYQTALTAEEQDILALATAFRDPPPHDRLVDYLSSTPVRALLHDTWQRAYQPFIDRPRGWLLAQLETLVGLRLLERVHSSAASTELVIDAHPLVRRAFEHVLGITGRRQSAGARAGFLRGRPDRRRAATLEQAREEVELFHAFCDASLWTEADSAFVALENPKHRLIAPSLERDLLVRFFPAGDWRQPPLWPGFGRYRSLAICFELLGQYEEALEAYREVDTALRGDALIALGRLEPLLEQPQVIPPWQTLWSAYRSHALVLAGAVAAGVQLARSLVPVDVYEWVHVFEALLRAGELGALDLRSVLYRTPTATDHRWSELARQRMRADYERLVSPTPPVDLGQRYTALLEDYDRAGLPYERTLTRLSYAHWLLATGQEREAADVSALAAQLVQQFRLAFLDMRSRP